MRSAFLAFFLALLLLLPGQGFGKEKSKYLVSASHTSEQCLATLDEVAKEKPKLLEKTWWGCQAGDHTAYAVLEAVNEEDARNMLPASERSSAKVLKVDKLTVKQIKAFHTMEEK